MAYAVASLVEVLEQDQHHLNLDAKPQIEYFLERARSFRDFFVKFSRLPKRMEARIIDASHKAEDIIETHITNQIRPACRGDVSLLDLIKLEEEFESIKLKIADECKTESRLPVDRSYINILSMTSNDPSRKKDVLLYEDDFQTLKGRLIEGPSQLQTISIYGMPGIGKRTLARRLYNDSVIDSHFEIRAWVNAAVENEVKGILLRLLDSLGKLTDEMYLLNAEQLGLLLRKALKKRKYFIVFHEVWILELWVALTRLFPSDNVGSRVLFTAWDWDWSDDFASLGPHMLRFLTDDESWLLFCHKVFGQEHCPEELVTLARRIIEKCKGISQVISIIAGLLATSEKTPTFWRLLDESLCLALSKEDHYTMAHGSVKDQYSLQENVFRLIYNHLPYWLKPCFLYGGAFDECCDIQASKMTKLWIAEGFVKQSGNNSLENIADAYLKILIDKNLLLLTREEPNGKVKAFQIQPFVRMFFLSQSHIDRFLLYRGLFDYDVRVEEVVSGEDEDNHGEVEDGLGKDDVVSVEDDYNHGEVEDGSGEDEDNHREVEDGLGEDDESPKEYEVISWEYTDFPETDDCMRRVSHHPLLEPSDETELPSHVRSFLSIGHASLRLAPVFLGSIFLRVLDVFQLEFYQFPEDILLLVLLRFLAFSCHSRLGTSFSNLQNLQTLIIRRLPSFRAFCLPFELWGITQLRHVKCKDTFILCYPENGKWIVHEKLQTLLTMQLFGVTNEFLGMIPNIKKLGIYCNIAMHDVLDLACLDKLQRLKCSSDWSLASHNFLSYLTFPLSLIKLTLSLCRIPWGYMKVVGSLPYLQELKVQKSDFVGMDSAQSKCEWEPEEGEFPQLLSLTMIHLDLVHWGSRATHFPRLQQLIIRNCYAMAGIPLDIGDIASLELIQVDKGSPSALASAMQIKEIQETRGNKLLQVQVTRTT